MDVETIGIALGGVVAGGLVAAGIGSWWWGRQLKGAAFRNSKLDQARQFAEQQGVQVKKQVEQLQKEIEQLRHQLARAKPRHEVYTAPPPPSRQELEDLLLRAETPKQPEAFPDTQVIPRKR
ncbi:MAG: hypothetical protein JO006_20885 [Paucibacter sp.]|nr:hypothetical protein [Roseateles sp.]